jgi:phosphate transport system protein
MSRHTHLELSRLSTRMAAQCKRVEIHLFAVFQAFLSETREGGDRLAQADEDIDQEEVLIEEECLKIIALHQPTGLDLRRLATFLKANNDLERIADHATNVARSLIKLPALSKLPQAAGLLVRRVGEAYQQASRALTQHDLDAANQVLSGDDVIDALEDAVNSKAREMAIAGDCTLDAAFELAKCAHDIERVADLAKNIAEDIIYLDTGDIVRHNRRAL